MKANKLFLLREEKVLRTIHVLLESKHLWGDASVTEISNNFGSPFHVLIACILSLRTKDQVTREASGRLFSTIEGPEDLASMSQKKLESLIFPVGFYRNKARTLREVSRIIVQEHGGMVPSELDKLLSFPGVGRKTANLVLSKGFGIPAICVDTHVHRISNRLGWIDTRKPEETEKELKLLLPQDLWIEVNDLLVPFGQKVCQPVSPWCSKCVLQDDCPKKGVTRNR